MAKYQERLQPRNEKFDPEHMYTMWACVSPRGYYLVAFRTKRAAQHERLHFRPESRIEKISVGPFREPAWLPEKRAAR